MSDFMDLYPYLNYLLKNKERAVVPGLGIFHLVKTPVKMDDQTGAFLPPEVKLEFIQMNNSDDNEIALLISLHKQISINEADSFVKSAVSGVWNALEKKEAITLKEVGELTMSGDGKVSFREDRSSPLLSSSYGMPTVETGKPIETRPDITEAEPDSVETVLKAEKIKRNKLPVLLIIILCLIFLCFTGGAVFLALNYNQATGYIHNKVLEMNDCLKKVFSMGSKTDTLTVAPKPPVKDSNTMALTKIKDTVQQQKRDTTLSSGGKDIKTYLVEPGPEKKYFIIAGCFRDLQNADKCIRELEARNYKPVIAGKTPQGLFRVCYNGGFLSKQDALNEMEKIREEFKNDPWLINY